MKKSALFESRDLSVLLFLSSLLLAALTVWYLFQDKSAYLTPEKALDSEAEGLIETESLDSGDGILRRYLPDESELDESDQDKSREVAGTDEQSLARNAKEESSAQEVLEQFAMENSWTEFEKRSNAGLWAEPCRQLFGDSLLDRSRLKRLGEHSGEEDVAEGVRMASDMLDFCGNIALQTELDLLDAMLAGDRSAYEAVAREREDLESALISKDDDLVRETLFEMIRGALARLDESALHFPLGKLAFGDLLQPPFPGAGSSDIYPRLIEPVSLSLLCWKLGGCPGARNPFVLRVCFSAYARSGLHCRDANSVQEALWQTLTPIEHEAYLAFLNQVISGVTAK
jgi:hypothetical protein